MSLRHLSACHSVGVVIESASRYRLAKIRTRLAAKSITGNDRGFRTGTQDSCLTDVFVGGFGVNPEAHCDIVDRLSGKVHLDKAVGVRAFNYSGHCYDLQTRNGIIIAGHTDGCYMVVSNCRCSLVSLTAAQARSRSGTDRGLNKIPRTPDGMPAGADLGFAFNPAEDILTAISRIIEEKAAALPPAIKGAAKKLGESVKKAPEFEPRDIDWGRYSETVQKLLDDREIRAVETYTASGFDYSYAYVNGYLREGKLYSDMTAEKMNEAIGLLDSAMGKVMAPADVILWRGTGLNNYGLAAGDLKDLVGKVLTDKAYSSTSHNLTVVKDAYAESGVILKIRARGGSNMLPVESMARIRGEYEVILPRDSRFEVLAVDESGKVPVIEVRLMDLQEAE